MQWHYTNSNESLTKDYPSTNSSAHFCWVLKAILKQAFHHTDTSSVDGLLASSLSKANWNAHHQHAKHHVIVVDEEDELLSPMRKLSGHLEHKVLHLSLQLAQDAAHSLARKCLVHTHDGCRELGVPPSDLKCDKCTQSFVLKEHPREIIYKTWQNKHALNHIKITDLLTVKKQYQQKSEVHAQLM